MRLRYVDGLLFWEREPKGWFPTFRRMLADSIKDADGNLHSEKNGQFVGAGATEGGANSKPPKPKGSGASKAERFREFIGNEIKGVKGYKALKALEAAGHGHVKEAFSREGLGSVAAIWGGSGAGVCHIKERRGEECNVDNLFKEVEATIAFGDILELEDRYEFWYEKKMCVVSKPLGEGGMKFLITAFPSRRKPKKFRKDK